MEMAVWILFCLFASIGLVQCGFWIFDAFKGPEKPFYGYHVFPLYDNAETLESGIRLGLAEDRRGSVLLVDMGMGEESREICDKLTRELYGVYICTKSELADTIERLDNLQNPANDVE